VPIPVTAEKAKKKKTKKVTLVSSKSVPALVTQLQVRRPQKLKDYYNLYARHNAFGKS
jgi:hypothetical protein